jgi:RNA polymerase sigma factor (sigma-70 family)
VPFRCGDHGDQDDEFLRFAVTVEDELLTVAYAWCRDRGRAEQFVQDTFERLLRSWSRLDADRNRVGYARRTLVNLMISDHRSPRTQREVPVDPADGFDFSHVYPVLAERDTAGELDLLRAVAALPAEQQQVVIARFWADLTVTQTATPLAVSERTVKSWTQLALDALRALLTDEEVDQ